MGMHFYAEVQGGEIELIVENPGYGEVSVRSYFPDYYVGTWTTTLLGSDLGRLLTEMTDRAFGELPEASALAVVPAHLTAADARNLLRHVQHAVLLATAGTDRYERVLPDPTQRPADPLCTRCSTGTGFSDTTTHSDACDRDGHQPFGYGSQTTWEQARTTVDHRQRRWQDRNDIGLTTP